jgi:hypothetical protein
MHRRDMGSSRSRSCAVAAVVLPFLFFGRQVGFLTCRTLLGPNPGFEAVRAVAGPMGRSVADLERMARLLFGERDASRQDYFPAPVPYRDVTLPKRLRFGYYLNGASSTIFVI